MDSCRNYPHNDNIRLIALYSVVAVVGGGRMKDTQEAEVRVPRAYGGWSVFPEEKG